MLLLDGDLRIVELVKMLANDNNLVYTYGLEKAEQLKTKKNVIICNQISDVLKDVDIIIGPIPFSSNGKEINTRFSKVSISIEKLINELNSKILIAGNISSKVYDIARDKEIKIIDIMKREELAILNTISTAEGAIEIAISNTNKILHGSKVLILGFGRIGKVLASKMTGLSVDVTCAARENENLAWIKAYGYKAIYIGNLNENLLEYEIIINTIPDLILTNEKLNHVSKDCLLIDLASNPGGIDRESVRNKKLKFIWALALPGKVAPVTTAKFIKDTIYNVLKEIYIK